MYLVKANNIIFQVEDTVRNFTEEEAEKCLIYIQDNLNAEDRSKPILNVYVRDAQNGEITLRVLFKEPKFERIRRITGYLSGSTNTWNDAKQAEERERVKHI